MNNDNVISIEKWKADRTPVDPFKSEEWKEATAWVNDTLAPALDAVFEGHLDNDYMHYGLLEVTARHLAEHSIHSLEFLQDAFARIHKETFVEA